MRYELFFWGMLAVVASAAVAGILLGWLRSIAAILAGALSVSAIIAISVAVLHAQSEMAEGRGLSVVASFMFSVVISVAFALLTRRILVRARVA